MEKGDWKEEYSKRITRPEKLAGKITLSPEERAFFNNPENSQALPFAVTEYYLKLCAGESGLPLRKQAIPTEREFQFLPYETGDPLEDNRFSPVPRLIHRYPNRALLLVSNLCALYCRHCFRRHFAQGKGSRLSNKEITQAAQYLRDHGEIKELLLSGGDPLSLGDRDLGEVLKQILLHRRDLTFRLCTRMPVVLPSRITPALIEELKVAPSLWVITHFNHPLELTPESSRALRLFLEAGIPVANQTVLLRGVNDDPDSLVSLFEGLLYRKVKPYYLLQGDLAAGTAHFRVPLDKSYALVRDIRKRLSGLAMPVFALDLPGGGGKIVLQEDFLPEREGEDYIFQSPEGKVFRYPAE